jgi:TRAP-type mannitol/chloroaromatic compound transport system substrate-binding protein
VQKELKRQTMAIIDEKSTKDAFTKKVWDSQKRFASELVDYEAFTKVQAD